MVSHIYSAYIINCNNDMELFNDVEVHEHQLDSINWLTLNQAAVG